MRAPTVCRALLALLLLDRLLGTTEVQHGNRRPRSRSRIGRTVRDVVLTRPQPLDYLRTPDRTHTNECAREDPFTVLRPIENAFTLHMRHYYRTRITPPCTLLQAPRCVKRAAGGERRRQWGAMEERPPANVKEDHTAVQPAAQQPQQPRRWGSRDSRDDDDKPASRKWGSRDDEADNAKHAAAPAQQRRWGSQSDDDSAGGGGGGGGGGNGRRWGSIEEEPVAEKPAKRPERRWGSIEEEEGGRSDDAFPVCAEAPAPLQGPRLTIATTDDAHACALARRGLHAFALRASAVRLP